MMRKAAALLCLVVLAACSGNASSTQDWTRIDYDSITKPAKK